MPFDIQSMLLDALQASGNAQNTSGKESNVLNDVLAKLGVTNASTQSAIDAKAADTNIVQGQSAQSALDTQNATIKFAQAAGTDIQSPENILIDLGNKLRAQTQAAQVAQNNIQEKEGRRIIDNPLSWLQGQITVGNDYQNYNNAVDNANLAAQNIQAVTQATDEVGRTQLALQRKVSAASITAAADANIQDATLAKNQAQEGYLKSEVAIAGAISQNSAAQAAEAQRRFGAVISADQQELEHQKFAMRKAEFDWEKEAKALSTKKQADADAARQSLLDQYNIGAKVMGYAPENNWDALLTRIELGGADKTRISAVMEAGGNTIAAGGVARVAATPGGAAFMLNSNVYARGNDPSFAPMKKYLKDTLTANIVPGMKPDQIANNVNTAVKADAERFTKDAVTTGSFYAPPPIASITATRSVQATPLYQKVLATAGKDLTTAAPTPIFDLTYAAVNKGTITLEEAAKGLNEFYGQAVNINNSEKRFSQVGIPSQTSFNVKPDTPGLEGVTVDLTDYSSTLRALAIKKSRERLGFGASTNPFSM